MLFQAFAYIFSTGDITSMCFPLISLSFPNSSCIKYSILSALSHNTRGCTFILELKLHKRNCILLWLLQLDYKLFECSGYVFLSLPLQHLVMFWFRYYVLDNFLNESQVPHSIQDIKGDSLVVMTSQIHITESKA